VEEVVPVERIGEHVDLPECGRGVDHVAQRDGTVEEGHGRGIATST